MLRLSHPFTSITEIDVTNPEAYGAEFAPKAQATIKAAGGRFVVIGGTAGVGAKPITAMGRYTAKACLRFKFGTAWTQ